MLFAACPSLSPLSQKNTNLFFFFITISLLEISRISNTSVQNHYYVLLHSLSIIILNTNYVIECISTSFHFIAELYSVTWMSTFCFSHYLLMTFGLFPISSHMNQATMNIHVCVFAWTYVFFSLGVK